MELIFTGGGTLGSVMPLLAVLEELKTRDPSLDFLWVGTKGGPERVMVLSREVKFRSIIATRLRRYFDLRNIFVPFLVVAAVIQSLLLLRREKPSIVVSAGGFVGLPLIWAAWICRVPVFIHQEDVLPGLANRLAAPFAEKITVTFERSAKAYSAKKTLVLGNPVRPEIFDYSIEEARDFFKLEPNVPTIFVVGGGTGSAFLNHLVWDNLEELTHFCQIIHGTGRGKSVPSISANRRYHQYELLTEEYADAVAVADLVISRAGMGALSEFAALGKPLFLIPLPGHQEANAGVLSEAGAAEVLRQKDVGGRKFVAEVEKILASSDKLKEMAEKIHAAVRTDVRVEMADLIMEVARG
jgi:UDP-N-acetylglucosamine--N-acetylmuramyl-(pentapeptide) pyrophosphoryl-undecaprenol N-acetylglucosamine transferase